MANKNSPKRNSFISDSSSRASSLIEAIHTKRCMRFLQITESEFLHIGQAKRDATIFFSIGSFFLSTFVSIGLSCLFVDWKTLLAQIKTIIAIVAIVTLIISLGFFIWGILKNKGISDEINTIKNETEVNNEP